MKLPKVWEGVDEKDFIRCFKEFMREHNIQDKEKLATKKRELDWQMALTIEEAQAIYDDLY